MEKEIERKFLINTNWILEDVISEKEIHQTYLATGEEEVRIRKIIEDENEKHVLTIKKGKGLVREEYETEITKNTYHSLLHEKNTPLVKTRYAVNIGDKNAEIDVYHNENLKHIKVAEVEFENEEEATKFSSPYWFGQDVTEDTRYKNQHLWETLQK